MIRGARQAHSLPKNFILQETSVFLKDMQDLFARRKFAHIGNHRYSLPEFEGDKVNGLALWNQISERAKLAGKYYIFSDEVEMIAAHFPQMAEFISDNTVLIDLGPGSTEAVIDKIGRILDVLGDKVEEYIGVDVVSDILDNTAEVFQKRFPEIKFSAMEKDFFFPLNLPKEKTRLAVIFGQTMFNIAVNPHNREQAKEQILNYLVALKAHLRPNDKLIIPQNCGEDEEEILAAYREQKEVWENLPQRIVRDLPVEGAFDPEGFKFQPKWFSSSRILSHTLVAKDFMSFKLGGEAFSIRPNDTFYCHNTVIYPMQEFSQLTQKAGLHTFSRQVNDKGRMALHGLELA